VDGIEGAAARLSNAAAQATDITGFYTASGYAPFIGQAAMLIWFFVASVSIIAKRQAPSPTPFAATSNA